MKVRSLQPADLEAAGALLFQAFAQAAQTRGFPAPWVDEPQARQVLHRHRDSALDHAVVAEEGGAVVGVGTLRVRGEIASVGPIASYVDDRGVGGALVDELLNRAEEAGVLSWRLYVNAWSPPSFALFAGRGFGVVDVVAHIERTPGPAPALDSARGLEVRAFQDADLDEVTRLDSKLTGHDRPRDLAALVRLVARRRGAIVGYLGAHAPARARDREFSRQPAAATNSPVRDPAGAEQQAPASAEATLLGPAMAVDVSDLFTLITHALALDHSWLDPERPLRARLSTAAPAAAMAAIGLGFRIRELGAVLSRGAPPPARPPQLYSMDPEIL